MPWQPEVVVLPEEPLPAVGGSVVKPVPRSPGVNSADSSWAAEGKADEVAGAGGDEDVVAVLLCELVPHPVAAGPRMAATAVIAASRVTMIRLGR